MRQQKGLGRGLDALFGNVSNDIMTDAVSSAPAAVAKRDSMTWDVPLSKITPNPTQPRRDFGEEELRELSQSIAELGVIQPITVRVTDSGEYTIISGERRWRAALMAGLTTIPAYIREADDEQMQTMALVENLLREDLNPLEISIALQRLMEECGLTQESLSKRVSMKRSSISNYLRLLKLSDEVQFAIKSGAISMGHAKAIASVESAEQQRELLRLCSECAISVRQAEEYAQRCSNVAKDAQQAKSGHKVAEGSISVPDGFESLSKHLLEIFPKGVTFKGNSRGGGKIVINYSSKNELQQLIKELDING